MRGWSSTETDGQFCINSLPQYHYLICLLTLPLKRNPSDVHDISAIIFTSEMSCAKYIGSCRISVAIKHLLPFLLFDSMHLQEREIIYRQPGFQKFEKQNGRKLLGSSISRLKRGSNSHCIALHGSSKSARYSCFGRPRTRPFDTGPEAKSAKIRYKGNGRPVLTTCPE